MILTISKHGRTRADCEALVRHLEKPENDFVKIAAIGNSMAKDLRGVLQDMRILRDGSRSRASLHHIAISPATNLTETALLTEAHRARLEFDPLGERPFVILIHGKARENSKSKEGETHAHLVLGAANAEGKALPDSRSIIRGEICARLGEFHNNEPATPSRHHATVLKWLRQRGHHLVADWLVAAHGENPEKPVSAMSAATRQRAKRHGLNLPRIKGEICRYWAEASDISRFESRLNAQGYAIERGQKPGVWIVRHSTGMAVGSLDRLLKIKRQIVNGLMEQRNERPRPHREPRNGPANGRTRTPVVRSGSVDLATVSTAGALAGSARRPQSGGSQRSDFPHRRTAGNNREQPTEPANRNAAVQREARSHGSKIGRARTLRTLSEVGRRLQRSMARVHFTDWKTYKDALPDTQPNWFAKDMWGVAIIPRPRF